MSWFSKFCLAGIVLSSSIGCQSRSFSDLDSKETAGPSKSSAGSANGSDVCNLGNQTKKRKSPNPLKTKSPLAWGRLSESELKRAFADLPSKDRPWVWAAMTEDKRNMLLLDMTEAERKEAETALVAHEEYMEELNAFRAEIRAYKMPEVRNPFGSSPWVAIRSIDPNSIDDNAFYQCMGPHIHFGGPSDGTETRPEIYGCKGSKVKMILSGERGELPEKTLILLGSRC